MNVHAGRSGDGVAWELDPEPIFFEPEDNRVARDPGAVPLRLRPAGHVARGPLLRHLVQRLPRADDRRRVHARLPRRSTSSTTPFCRSTGTGCSSRAGSATATRCSSRPSDGGHTPFGDIFYSESPDLVHWGRHRHVMAPIPLTWQSTKIGAGPTPIETDDGWLVLYHGVLNSCNGFVYSMGAALLDLDEPWHVLGAGRDYPARAAGAVRAGRRRAERRVPMRGSRRSRGRTVCRSTTGALTRWSASRTATSRRSSTSCADDDRCDSSCAFVHERELRRQGARLRRGGRVGALRRRDERCVRAARDASPTASTTCS